MSRPWCRGDRGSRCVTIEDAIEDGGVAIEDRGVAIEDRGSREQLQATEILCSIFVALCSGYNITPPSFRVRSTRPSDYSWCPTFDELLYIWDGPFSAFAKQPPIIGHA